MKPLLKWAGGKSRLAPLISEAFGAPCAGVYYEPFVGSASVFLARRARGEVAEAVLSDVNPKLVQLHAAVRDDVDGVLEALHALPGEDSWRERYYDVREAFNAGPHVGPLHAARFLWLNRTGFNGLYRENRGGAFNVPVGRYAQLRLPDEAHLRAISAMLAGVTLRTSSFEDIMAQAGRGDQVYCDPPYVPLTATAAFTAYAKVPFGMDAQRALANAAERAAFRGAKVVLSNHDLPLVRQELYKEASGFRVVASPLVARPISQKVHARKSIQEVVCAIGPMLQVA